MRGHARRHAPTPGVEPGNAVFDGDPCEYTAHCTAVVIDGRIVTTEPR